MSEVHSETGQVLDVRRIITDSDRKGIELQKILDRIENNFTYHAPKPGQPELYTLLRSKEKELAIFIAKNTPVSREQSVALTKLEEVMFWANAAIARE